MPYKDPKVRKEKAKIISDAHYQKNKDDESFRKRRRFTQWKHYGIKGDYEEMWRIYENTTHCYDCNKILTNKRGNNCKVTDHHHASGHFRHIICQCCNQSRGKNDRQRMSICLELHRYFLLN